MGSPRVTELLELSEQPENIAPLPRRRARPGNAAKFQGIRRGYIPPGVTRPPATPYTEGTGNIPFIGYVSLRRRAAIEKALKEARKALANAKSQANRNRLKAQVNNLENAVRQLKNRPEDRKSTRLNSSH